MDHRALLLLGLLMTQSQHGYQINEFIERNLSRVTDMKKATAYAILDRLAEAGYISVHVEQEGNRPPRKVFAITPAGEALFQQLLRERLQQADRFTFAGDIGLMFLDHLPRAEAIACLEQRLRQVEARLAEFQQAPHHRCGIGVDLALAHVTTMLQAERDWLAAVVERLKA
jgi:DNA-binding PadR family transcriptional regulator